MKKIIVLLCCLYGILQGNSIAYAAVTPVYQYDQVRNGENSKLCLVWQQINSDKREVLPAIPAGVHAVVSPCWFDIRTAAGEIECRASKQYVQEAHKEGREVWALITNSFDPDMTTALLRDKNGRKKAIEQMVSFCRQFGLDGLNLDFENIYDGDKELLSSFVRDIATELHKENKIVSIDVTVPSNMPNWSTCYDRKTLGETVDYVVLMAYDEHGSKSPVSGSVASLPWVEKGIRETLQTGVAADKLVLGMPLYMRIWEEQGNKVSARTLRMPAVKNLLEEKKLQRVWLQQEGQYYFEYTERGIRYRVWQEDARSLALKSALISRYDLAGGALWKSGVETEDVWKVLADSLGNAAR